MSANKAKPKPQYLKFFFFVFVAIQLFATIFLSIEFLVTSDAYHRRAILRSCESIKYPFTVKFLSWAFESESEPGWRRIGYNMFFCQEDEQVFEGNKERALEYLFNSLQISLITSAVLTAIVWNARSPASEFKKFFRKIFTIGLIVFILVVFIAIFSTFIQPMISSY